MALAEKFTLLTDVLFFISTFVPKHFNRILMDKIYCIGETIYDIIFKQGTPVAARAGGSMLNSAVSLGRSGLRVEMITEIGDDQVGEKVMDFLKVNNVSLNFTRPQKGFQTPVSLAFLDEKGDAGYSFYKNYPAERLEINWPIAEKGDVVLYGSFYSLDPSINQVITGFAGSAEKAGALTLYDPNIRKNHLGQVSRVMPLVERNISLASILRCSDEDFFNLYGVRSGTEAFRKILSLGCHCLIYTKGSLGAELHTPVLELSLPAKPTEVVSTIGAGDGFNAGIIFGLIRHRMNTANLQSADEETWKKILSYASDFASLVCQSYDNYIPPGKFHIDRG